MRTPDVRGNPNFFNCGHARTPENSQPNGRGANPICKTCAKERRKARPKKKKPLPALCRRKHPYTPQNTIITKSGNRNCRTCWEAKLKEMRVEKPVQVVAPATQCHKGHDLTPDNLVEVNGRFTCRTCRNEYNRESLRLKRLGLQRVRKCPTWGMAPEQKIAFYRQPPDENGCRLWTGPKDKAGRPHLQMRAGPQKSLYSLPRAWEEGSGQKFPEGHVVKMNCPGGDNCTTYEHMEVIPWVKLVRTEANIRATARYNRRRYKKLRDKRRKRELERQEIRQRTALLIPIKILHKKDGSIAVTKCRVSAEQILVGPEDDLDDPEDG